MATWGELLQQLKELVEKGVPGPHDKLRRGALAALHEYTDRNTILYAVAHLQKPEAGQGHLSITHADIEGFMETVYGLEGEALDLILHSPGGTPDAANALVQYLRSKFTDIRVIVPHMAMSAATMLACASDRILMGRHSYLGPIDPQLMMQTEVGVRLIPADAILEQFEMAKSEATDQTTLAVWYPILRQYGPDLLVQCKNAKKHAESLVAEWLRDHMFSGSEDAPERAKKAASLLATHGEHLSHSRPLGRDYLRDELGLEIEELEGDQELQDRVLTVYHAMSHTLSSTGATKVIENHEGRSYVQLSKPIQLASGKPADGDSS